MMKTIFVMLIAMTITIGLFILLGYTPYVFSAYLATMVIMYFYATTEKIDDTLFKTMTFISFTIILGWWYVKNKKYQEGYYVTPLKRISTRMTTRQCQDYCGGTKHCKYSYVPLGTSTSGIKTSCWNSYGRYQRKWGPRNRGGDVWRNKKYIPPPPITKFNPGMKIALYNVYSRRWLSAETNGRIGHRTRIGPWEKFTLLKHPDGKNLLLKTYHGSYLSFLPRGMKSHYGVRPWYNIFFPMSLFRSPTVFSAKNARPTKGWTWQRIQFKKSGRYWGIYNSYRKLYLNAAHNQYGLTGNVLGNGEKIRIFRMSGNRLVSEIK